MENPEHYEQINWQCAAEQQCCPAEQRSTHVLNGRGNNSRKAVRVVRVVTALAVASMRSMHDVSILMIRPVFTLTPVLQFSAARGMGYSTASTLLHDPVTATRSSCACQAKPNLQRREFACACAGDAYV